MTSDRLTANTSAATVAASADALVRAGQLQAATDLLDATTAHDDRDRALLALSSARVALESDYRSGTIRAPQALAAADAAVGTTDDALLRWDLALLRVRGAYIDALFADRSAPRFGPAGRDPHEIASLQESTKRLHDASPDPGRRGWASMFQGYVADNIAGERGAAPAHFAEALACAEEVGDDYLVFEALRHLGDHDRDDGDLECARQRWERSAEHAARAGAVAGTLAQQILLAVLARDVGDEAGAQALAREIGRWAGAIGATRLRDQARELAAGVDPTAPPPEQTT